MFLNTIPRVTHCRALRMPCSSANCLNSFSVLVISDRLSGRFGRRRLISSISLEVALLIALTPSRQGECIAQIVYD